MDEKYISDLYNQLGGKSVFGEYNDFKFLINTDDNYASDVYNQMGGESVFGKYDDFRSLTKGGSLQPLEKKNDITESPSEVGSLASSESADPEALRFAELASGLQDKNKSQIPTSYATSKQFQKDLVEAPIKKSKEDKELAQAQLTAASDFDKLGEKPKVEQSKYLNEQLVQINKDLIGKTEEFVVPEMEYRFGKLGFKFEEAEAGRDYMNVKASNGKTTQISLDNFLSSTSAAEALKLQKFIQDNTPTKGLFVIEKTLREQDKTFNSQKEVDDEVARMNQEATAVNQKQKDFILRRDAFEKEVEELNKTPESQWNTPEFIKKVDELEKKRVALSNEMPTLLSEEDALTKKASALDRSVGSYVSTKAKQGTWYGGIGNEILAGFGSILADAQGRFIDISTELLPTGMGMGEDFGRQIAVKKAEKIGANPPFEGQSMDAWKETLTEKQLDAWEDEVDDAKKKFLKDQLQPAARGGLKQLTEYVVDTNTTPEWEQLKKEGFWGGAILGLARSLPAMIGSSSPMGWVQRTAQMYAQVSDGLMQEMEKDPAFADISESEKAAIIAPIGLVSSVLEAYGLRNVLQSKGIVTSITMAVLGKASRGVGNKSFRELVENEVTSRIAKGALVVTAAGLAEAETGAAQQISETGFKAVYNMIKGEDLFKNPQTIQAFVKEVAIAGAQEAVGGFVLGVPSAVGAAYSKKGFLKMDDKTFETFENMANDGSLQSAYITSLKEKIASGKISASDAKDELQKYRTAVGVYRQLPDGLTVQQKKEAMNLLKERKDLEQYIEGKDAALVTPQKNRINEINQELSKIAEQKQDKIDSETNDVATQRAAKMAELSKAIEDDDKASELNLSTKLPTEERQRIEKQLQDLKAEQDAFQEQAAGEVPVQSGATVSQEVAQGEPQAEPQVTAEAGVQEEVTPQVELTDDQIVEYNPTEEVADKNNEVLGKVLQSKKFEPQAEPQRTDLGDSVVFEYNNFDDDNTRTWFTFKKKKDGTITGVGVKVDRNKGDFRGTDLFRNYVNSKRVASAQTAPLTQEQQMASMEQMFMEEEAPTTQPVKFEGATVSDPIQVESLKSRVQDKGKKAVVDFAQKTLTTLKSVLPNFEIVVHDDENSYANAMSAVNGNAQSAGYFSYIQNPDGTYVGKIDINLNKANNATVAHEVAHGIMRKTFGENTEAFKTLKNRIAAVLNQEGNQALTDFANQYEENDSYEEYLVELAAQLTQSDKNISPTLLQNIASIINEVVSKITNGAFTPFQNVKDTKQTIEFLRNISESIRKGEAINPADITAIQEGLSVPIGSPTTINPLPKGKASLNFPKEPLPLSFVTEADKIDINALIDDIVAKKQKVWFWMADQLGRGNYYDEVIEGEHYLDAGPSFALDPANRSKGILWASGLSKKTLTSQINKTDYIFFISGSPEKAKLFNKRVLDLLAERVNKTSDFNKFREALNNFDKETKELTTLREALNEVNSFKELMDSTKRKPFLIALDKIGSLKTAPKGSLKELLGSFNAFIDYNELRDGFYRENGFNQNDIMLVGKPTGLAGKASHSTYEFAISGEVVGVPDKKVDSWVIMPESLKEIYKKGNKFIDSKTGKEKVRKGLSVAQKAKIVAAETGVVRELETRMKGKAQLIGENAKLSATVKFNLNLAKAMNATKFNANDIRWSTGWEKGKDRKWRYEIPDGKFKDIDLNDLKKEGGFRTALLGDVFNAPDLYAAYPNAKEIKVIFKDLPRNDFGSYSEYNNKITVNQNYYNDDREVAELTLLHEIQHYIQYREAFESGANSGFVKGMMVSIKNGLNDSKRDAYQMYKNTPNTDKDEKAKARDYYNEVKRNYEIVDKLSEPKPVVQKRDYIKRIFGNSDYMFDSAFNLYLRVAGEVEARNVEARNKLTPEQRKRTLLTETEDVNRADQVLIDYYRFMYEEEVADIKNEFKGKAQLNTEAKAKKVVQQARAQGFSEDVIKSFLESKGISKADIKKAMAKDIPAAGRVTLSEETLDGYESLMEGLERLSQKGTPISLITSRLKNSKIYINATDVQKEKLVREVRKMFGLRQKSAPTAKRILGQLKDITKITMTETQVLKKRIKELAEGAAAAKKSIAEANKFLADEIKQMVTDGKITLNQATSLTVRALKMNPLSEASISNFVDYVAKVFSKAEYVGKMTTALAQIKKAKENIKTKIGVAEDLFIPLKQLLSINPTLIPLNQLEKYLGILEDFGARKAVLSIDDRVKVLKEVNEILEEVSNELSLVDVLADRFNNYDEQVFNKEGALDYAATIKKMIDEGLISTDEADLMRKYKSEILPQVERTDLTEEEIAEQKKDEIKILKALKIDNKEFPLPSRDEKEDALNLAKLIKELNEADLMNLSLTELKNIIKVIGNINNGYLPHYAKVSIEKLNAIKEGKVLSNAIERAKPLPFSKLYSRLKERFTKKDAVDELIRANPLYYIDNVFGDFKTRDIFNSLLEQSSQALARFNSELKRVSQKIDIAQNKVLASFNQNPDKYLMSKFRMTTYMLQREYESNVGKKGVRPVSEYLKETIKHIRKGKSVFKEADAEKLEQILEELDAYTVDGTVDLDKFYNTFNNAEKNAIKVMTEINASLGEKAAYTASVIRGNKVELMDNYFHHNVLHEQNPMDATAAPEFSNSYSNSMRPTTKAKSLIERTGALTPLNFDLFTSTQKGAKFVLLDYNLTSPIRTARRTLIQAEKNLESNGLMNKEKIQIFNAINNAYEEALENILTNNIVQDDLSNEVFDFIQKQGYRAALAGTTRFQAELASNIVNALIINPKGFATGIKHAKLIASANGYEFMKNAKSKQTSRLYASDALSGRMVDPQILKQTSGIKGSISRSALRNRTAQFYNLTLKRFVQNPVEYIADTMLTTPDKVVSMPLWFGSFMNEFKRITGEEVNQEMMINNDLDYMQKYADAIEQATRKADQESVYSGAANNEFMGVLKGKLKPNQGFTQKAWNNFNSYMTNFMNFDYAAARSAVYNLFNEGYMTKKKAAAVLAGITTRSVIYQVMVANMGAGIVGAALGLAFDWEDEEEVDEKSYLQMLGRGLTNVLVGYTLGRNFGNAVRGMINFGVEKVNEEYLDFLRNGEYDFYKDNIAYTYLNVGDRGDIDVPKMAISMAGAYTPALNTAVLIGKNFGAISSRVAGEGSTKKEPEAIRREDMTVNYRIPLEVAGNAGLIPLYKDIKKAVNDEIYKDLRKAANTPDSSIPSADEYDKLRDLRELKEKSRNQEERRAIDKKIVEIVGSEEAKAAIDKQKEALTASKKRLLYDRSGGQRYDNESDMKRLNPSLWRKRFGPNSEWAKKTKAKEAVESKLEKESKAREDREFRKKKRGN